MQQFYSKKYDPSSTALLPTEIRFFRQIVINASINPKIMSPLPMIIRELYDAVEMEFCGIYELILIPFA